MITGNAANTVYMKYILLIILCFSTARPLYAQYPKYIVRFADKNHTGFSLDKPGDYLSARSIARRTRYSIATDSTDLPVSPAYIDSVLSRGDIRLLSISNWLNQILIYTTDTQAIPKIAALPFVTQTKAIGFRTSAQNRGNIFKEKIQPLDAPASFKEQGNNLISYGNNYNQVHIHKGEFLHNKGFTGNGMVIAILDAGFYQYTSISAFDSIRLNNQLLGVRDYVDYDNSVVEDNIHGMFCLSIIAANWPGRMVGTAPKASFWLLRSENANSEYPIEEHNWAVAAQFADSAGADLITSSLGYNQFDDASFNHTYADFYQRSTMVSKAAAFAAAKGLIVTNSAGNSGLDSWKYLIFPADADSVCTVGAVDNSGQIAGFSSYGYPGKIKPNIVSVGDGTVIAGFDAPITGSGTSFSNPNINGLIACLWQAFPAYNNMAILDAIYKSADRYTIPDNRYGYGIPDMKTAYRLLKHRQNTELYGNDWLFATPNPFTNQLNSLLIGQVDGHATLTLKDASGKIIAVQKWITEKEEVYTHVFDSLTNLPGGIYQLVYNDSLSSRILVITKQGPVLNDWLQASPVPFNSTLTVYIKAPESGNATLRLADVYGHIITTESVSLTADNIYTVHFGNSLTLAPAVYFVQYIGPQHRKTIKVLKY